VGFAADGRPLGSGGGVGIPDAPRQRVQPAKFQFDERRRKIDVGSDCSSGTKVKALELGILTDRQQTSCLSWRREVRSVLTNIASWGGFCQLGEEESNGEIVMDTEVA
jgi:hypothetical protein